MSVCVSVHSLSIYYSCSALLLAGWECSICSSVLNIELFMYHVFKVCQYQVLNSKSNNGIFIYKTLQSDTYRSRNFDIILDCMSYTSKSEVPLQWLTWRYCTEIIPPDIRRRFSTTRILNSNTLSQKYLRRLYNIFAGKLVSSMMLFFLSCSLIKTRHPTL
jgi:hypothetical protein